jgi:hypothetical protein
MARLRDANVQLKANGLASTDIFPYLYRNRNVNCYFLQKAAAGAQHESDESTQFLT